MQQRQLDLIRKTIGFWLELRFSLALFHRLRVARQARALSLLPAQSCPTMSRRGFIFSIRAHRYIAPGNPVWSGLGLVIVVLASAPLLIGVIMLALSYR